MRKLKTKTNEQAKQKQPHRSGEQTGGFSKGGGSRGMSELGEGD